MCVNLDPLGTLKQSNDALWAGVVNEEHTRMHMHINSYAFINITTEVDPDTLIWLTINGYLGV